jgi:hypothetical protein
MDNQNMEKFNLLVEQYKINKLTNRSLGEEKMNANSMSPLTNGGIHH